MSIIKVDEIQGNSGGSSVTISGHKPTVPFDLNASGSITPHDGLNYLKWATGTLTDFTIPTSKTTQAPWTNTTTLKSALVEGNGNDALSVSVGNPSNNYGDTFILGNQDANYNLKSGLSVSGHSTFLVGGADGEVKLYKLNATTGNADEKLSTSSTGVSVTGNLKIATAGDGIDFSATAGPPTSGSSGTSELLDDYEEGTMTLIMGGLTNISNSNARIQADNVGSNQARYTKVGTLCYIEAYFFSQSTTVIPTGGLVIQGLPFSAVGNGGCFVSQAYNMNFPSSNNGIEVAKFMTSGGTQLNGLNNRMSQTWDDVSAGTAMPNNTTLYFRIAGTYRTQ